MFIALMLPRSAKNYNKIRNSQVNPGSWRARLLTARKPPLVVRSSSMKRSERSSDWRRGPGSSAAARVTRATTIQLERMLRRLVPEDRVLAVEAERDIWVRADRGQIEQVVVNLVINAQDATTSGGAISISVAAPDDGESALLIVSDTGSRDRRRGSSPHLRVLLHYQGTVHGHRAGPEHGPGHRRAERWLHRREHVLGAGTEFTVRLPREAPADPGGGDRRKPPATKTELAGQTILVVEDDPAVRQLMKRTLEGAGLHVLACDIGQRRPWGRPERWINCTWSSATLSSPGSRAPSVRIRYWPSTPTPV